MYKKRKPCLSSSSLLFSNVNSTARWYNSLFPTPSEFSPNNLIPPKLFVTINLIDIYISFDKFVLDGSILMELRSHSPSFFVDGMMEWLSSISILEQDRARLKLSRIRVPWFESFDSFDSLNRALLYAFNEWRSDGRLIASCA